MTDPNKQAFEDAIWNYYQDLKAMGWSDSAEGDPSSREALFWRTPTGLYGVEQLNAAWKGWQLAMSKTKPLTPSEVNRLYMFLMAEQQDGLTHEQFRRAAAGVQKALGLTGQLDAPAGQKTWCGYAATMVGAYLGMGVDDERIPVMAQVIERRLWALPPVPQELQPMDTAPKDEFILLCCPSGYTTTPFVFTTGIMHSDYKVGRWIDHANDDLTDWGMVPVGWMPLPKVQP